jgi:hypothetical protein
MSDKETKGRFKASLSSTAIWFRGFTTVGGLTQARDSDNRVSRYRWWANIVKNTFGEFHRLLAAKKMANFTEFWRRKNWRSS